MCRSTRGATLFNWRRWVSTQGGGLRVGPRARPVLGGGVGLWEGGTLVGGPEQGGDWSSLTQAVEVVRVGVFLELELTDPGIGGG